MLVLDRWDNGNGTYTLTLSNKTTTTQTNPVSINFTNAIRSGSRTSVHIAAAGNTGIDLDKTPLFPACFPSDLIVCVGGSTRPATPGSNEFPTSSVNNVSNFGAHAVDLFAPGEAIYSTITTGTGYGTQNGTSAAAAQVCGAVALMRGIYPTQAERKIAAGVILAFDPKPGLATKCRTGGRLNLWKAVTNLLPLKDLDCELLSDEP